MTGPLPARFRGGNELCQATVPGGTQNACFSAWNCLETRRTGLASARISTLSPACCVFAPLREPLLRVTLMFQFHPLLGCPKEHSNILFACGCVSIYFSGAAQRIPKIEYCVSFWAENITCYWEAQPETDPPTTYTLHVTEEAGRCRRDFGDQRSCVATQGERSCGVAVENLFAFYKIQLTAESQQAQANSLEKCVHGMSIVKLSSPVVNSVVANQSRCFRLEWRLPADEVLSATQAQYEIQYRDTAEVSWTQMNFTAAENMPTFADVCGVFPFTNYSIRVRAKYHHSSSFKSDGEPSWSDWSMERFVRTLPTAPSRGPALWRKLGTPGSDGMREVVLMWKPLKPREANGEILAYSLHSQRKGETAVPLCLTRDLRCTLLLPAGERLTFSITASNAVGESPPTKLVVPPADGQEAPPSPLPVLASPAGDHGILLQWSLPSFPRMGYIFEWGRLPGNPGDGSCWHYQPGNINHVVIAEAIKPGNLYRLKVFALLDGNVWAVGSVSAYSKQIAPLRAPTLYPIRVWKSRVELQWEKLPLEERGGEIQNYTISYEEEGKDQKTAVVVPDSSVHRYLIEGLAPGSTVRVSITVATEGGSTEGPVLSIRTKIYESAFYPGSSLVQDRWL
ncbi:granulocyte colony-stimulating factor receptor-like [Elgaria multicarinata webbii]|uniref:granulocyte colony-stimulating factor receptor-like n=1 Tax=Elgaria multicarinata webbii TaxID=159646 RepID=UPI002FCD39D8